MPSLEASRELDMLIAEKVMGWMTYTEYVHGPMMHGGATMTLYRGSERDGVTQSVDSFRPSINIASALKLLDKFDGLVTIWRMAPTDWRVSFGGTTYWAKTLPLAICHASLAFRGIKTS